MFASRLVRASVVAAAIVVGGCVAPVTAADAPRAAGSNAAPRAPWKTSRVVGAPDKPEPYRIAPAFTALRFERPTSLERIPGSNRLLVTEMGGRVSTFVQDAATERAELVLDLKQLLPKELADKGVSLFDAELHPKFVENRWLYLCYVHPGDGRHTRLSRFTLDAAPAPRLVAGSEQVVITWPSGGHNGGCLEFGPDGLLYVSTGDGSGPNPPDGLTTGQTVTDLLGAVLRLDVDRPTGDRPYAVPSDNPFVDLPGARPEIWAYGLRNPWKFGVDRKSGEVFVADNGWESWEMVHRAVRGGNCGWPVMEGRASLRSEVPVGPTPIRPPVKDHPHTEANSVIGGPVYRGEKLKALDGSFVYGDYITGTIWAIRPDKDNAYSHTTLVDTDQRIVAFAEGHRGELLVVDYDFTGQIYELLPSDVPDTSATFPRRLSETGLFASLETMTPAAGVVPYSVRADRWVDGAQAERWVAIPGDGRIQLATDAPAAGGSTSAVSALSATAVYPEGTVLVKHLTLPRGDGVAPLRLETQLLHFERGVWRPYSYLWDEAGRDAALVDSNGASRPLRVGELHPPRKGADGKTADVVERTWHVNATNECKLCHNAGPKFVLGFVANQLNRPASGVDGSSRSDGAAENQLSRLAAAGVIFATPAIAADHPSRLVDPHDASQPLDDRARSYLHANCGMCHHPGGNAIVSFFLRRDLPFDKLNTDKGTGIGTFGMRNARLIVPGDPYRSVVMYRMSKLGYARMPYIGSRMVDSAGVALVEQWIRQLPGAAATRPVATSPAGGDAVGATALAALGTSNGKAKDGSLAELTQSTERALALALRLHGAVGASAGIGAAEREAAIAAGAGHASSDVRGLFETFVPESRRRATLGPTIDPQTILSRTGDAERGKLIFFSDGARCRACHELDDRQRSLGPTLQEIVKKYPRPAELLQHVLQPSSKIDEPFAAYTLITTDGRVLTGMVVEKSARETTVRTVEKQNVRVPADQIEELRKSDKSLMPDRILSDLTAQEAADLLEYVRTLGQ